MFKLTDRVEFIERYLNALRQEFLDFQKHAGFYTRLAEREWERLVRAGLAQARREPTLARPAAGWYEVQWEPFEDWEAAQIDEAGNWIRQGLASAEHMPRTIGRQIQFSKATRHPSAFLTAAPDA